MLKSKEINSLRKAMVNLLWNNQKLITFTTDRDEATENETWALIGLDHPYVTQALQKYSGQQIEGLGSASNLPNFQGVLVFGLSIYSIATISMRSILIQQLMRMAIGHRLEKQAEKLFWEPPSEPKSNEDALHLLSQMEEILDREIKQRYGSKSDQPYSAKLVSDCLGHLALRRFLHRSRLNNKLCSAHPTNFTQPKTEVVR